MTSKKLVLFGTNRHAIAINDFYMFFRRTNHEIVHIFYPAGDHANRDWWKTGTRTDAARDNVVDPIVPGLYPVTVWSDLEKDVYPILDSLSFDFICFGNGNDPDQKQMIRKYGREKFLFSEYGWLPWKECFYISREGTGFDSEIARYTEEDVDRLLIDSASLDQFKHSLDVGNDVIYENFLYVPLQKDKNDFKFGFTSFESNEEFLRTVDSVAPAGLPILVKRHPLYKKLYDLSFSSRMIDVSDMNLNKHQLYSRMQAMICINSTSILEALAYGSKVFSYGDDLFINKGLTYHKIMDSAEFERLLLTPIDGGRSQKFISLLFSRQINRHRCIANDTHYLRRHYWSVCL